MFNQTQFNSDCNGSLSNETNFAQTATTTSPTVHMEISGHRKNCSGDLKIGNEFGTVYCEPIQSTPLALVSGLVATAIITGNLLVILAILRGSSRFHRPIYWLIIHMSCADLLVGIMLGWNYCLASLLNIHNTIMSIMVIFSIWTASASCSLLGFVLLAIDRYLQIFYKSLHRTYATRMTVGLAIFFAWLFPILFYCIIPIFFDWTCRDSCRCVQREHMECLPQTECSQILPPFKKIYSLWIALILFILMPVPICIYTMIFVKVRRKTHLVKQSHKRQDMRLIKTLVVILAVFILTLSPVGVMLILDYYTNTRNQNLINITLYVFVVAFLNSLANPLLYMWRMAAIRRSVRQRLLFCCFWKKPNNGNSRRDITSFQSDQRSPTVRRHSINQEEPEFIGNNNNIPLSVLCLRQMKRGRYTTSRTSTPLSERSNNHVVIPEEVIQISKNDIHDNASVPMLIENSNNHGRGTEITEL